MDDEIKTVVTVVGSAIASVAGGSFAVGGAREKIATLETNVRDVRSMVDAKCDDINGKIATLSKDREALAINMASVQSELRSNTEALRELRKDVRRIAQRRDSQHTPTTFDEDT
jgi:archaellum component FlaC